MSLWIASAARAIGIRGGIAIAAIIAAGILLALLKSERADHEDTRQALAMEQARHAVTRQSVDTLEATIERMNERARERQAEYEEAQARAAERGRELARLEANTDRTIARLRELANRPGDGTCEVPEDIRELAEGL